MPVMESDYNSELIDVCVDECIDVFEKLQKAVEDIKPSNVPQEAAKARMIELIDRAFMPYMAEFAQCTQVFEQGVD